MAITVPKNPFSINVAIGSTENMGGLQAAPKTEFSQDALAQSVVERFDKFSQTVDKWQSELDQVRAKDLITQLEEKRLDRKRPIASWTGAAAVKKLWRLSQPRSLQDDHSVPPHQLGLLLLRVA